MAGKRGGYQKPSSPAPASGPGALSQRTDGGPADSQPIRVAPGGEYGERQDMQNLQASAPMAQAPAVRRQMPSVDVTPFPAATTRPDEPVTAGVDVGPGAGSSALGMEQPVSGSLSAVLRKMAGNDPTGDVGRLFDLAVKRGW